MENIITFLKKYLVLILCGALVLAALGAGIWYLTNPPVNDQNDASQETGNFDDNLNIDMGIGIPGDGESNSADTPNGEGSSDNVTVITPDDQSGIVNVPGGNSPSGSVTPVTPEDESNSSDAKPDNSNTSSDNENSYSNSGNEETPSDPSDEDPTSPTDNQSQPVDMVGGVVDNPFN